MRLNLPRLKEFSKSNDCGKTGKAVAGAETGGETGGWRRGCRGKTRAVRCPPTPLAPSASVRSIAGWVCGVCGVCGVYGGAPLALGGLGLVEEFELGPITAFRARLWHARLLRRIATAELGTFSQRATPPRCGRERSGVSRQKRRAGRRQGDQGGAAEAKRERHAAPVHPVHPAHPTHPAHPPDNRSNARGGGEGSGRAAYRSCFASASPSPPPVSPPACAPLDTVPVFAQSFRARRGANSAVQVRVPYAGFATED